MIDRTSFTDEDRERITETVREVSRFEEGDRVTVEPSDTGINYFGSEYEGVPLVVRGVFWRSNGLSAVRPGGRNAPEHSTYSEEHYVELTGDYEYLADEIEQVLVYDWEYKFYDVDGQRIPPLGERGLIPWSEYQDEHDRVFLPSESDNETHWLEPADEPCDVCGSNMMKHWHYDNGVQTAGGHECSACGDVKESNAP